MLARQFVKDVDTKDVDLAASGRICIQVAAASVGIVSVQFNAHI